MLSPPQRQRDKQGLARRVTSQFCIIQFKSVSVEETTNKDTHQRKSNSATRGAETNILATVEAMHARIKALQEQISEAKKSTSKSTNQQEETPS